MENKGFKIPEELQSNKLAQAMSVSFDLENCPLDEISSYLLGVYGHCAREATQTIDRVLAGGCQLCDIDASAGKTYREAEAIYKYVSKRAEARWSESRTHDDTDEQRQVA